MSSAVAASASASATAATRDRRTVDAVTAGDAASETLHGFAFHESTAGVHAGAPFRRATGWMRYALNVFDDTEVTVVVRIAPIDSVPRQFDVIVEDSLVATRSVTADSIVDVRVPLAVTKGRPNIAITLRAHGGTTPAFRDVRTVQDHNEL